MVNVEVRDPNGKLRATFILETEIMDDWVNIGGNWFPGVAVLDDMDIFPDEITDHINGMLSEVGFTSETFTLDDGSKAKWTLTGRKELSTMKDLARASAY